MQVLKTKKNEIMNGLFLLMLVTIPLPFIINSIAIIVFSVIYIYYYKKNFVFLFNFYLILPAFYFIFIVLSEVVITKSCSFSGIQKNMAFFIIPVFFLNKSFIKDLQIKKIIKYYSFSNVILALYFIINAFYFFIKIKDKELFFFQKLVGVDQNAIYVSVYASIAMFYFYVQKEKTVYNRISLMILLFFVFLLSSKTIIFIAVLLVIIHYFFYSNGNKSVRILTFICSFLFIVFSIYFVPEVNKRVLDEYETAFVDNTINELYSNQKSKTYNVSLKEAYFDKNFKSNQFFPGTAYRVFHIRLFREIISENKKWITGLGIGNVDHALQTEYAKYKVFVGQKYFNFHNQYIQSFAEFGILGFVTVISMVVLNLYNAINKKCFLHLVFALTMFVLFFTESFLIRQRGIIFFIVLYCLFNCYKKEKLKAHEKNTHNRSRRVSWLTPLR